MPNHLKFNGIPKFGENLARKMGEGGHPSGAWVNSGFSVDPGLSLAAELQKIRKLEWIKVFKRELVLSNPAKSDEIRGFKQHYRHVALKGFVSNWLEGPYLDPAWEEVYLSKTPKIVSILPKLEILQPIQWTSVAPPSSGDSIHPFWNAPGPSRLM